MAEKHIHQYVRVKLGKNKRPHMKCAIPGCVHNCKPELVVGRFSICNSCSAAFVLTKASASLMRPHCDSCTKGDKGVNIKSIMEKLGEL